MVEGFSRRRRVDGVERARRLRREMSAPEALLWRHLRTRPGGFKFRRQHPLGPFALDFYCREAAVAIEVDGAAHDMGNNPERDGRRDEWVAERGILTLRFLAVDVLRSLDAVARQIEDVCRSRAPQRRGGGDRKDET